MTKLQIFVASPGDVSEERERLDRIVDELNRTIGDRTSTVLELVRWETHAWPGFGEDAQDVINRQIKPYDIFLGIMWKRLGTPTRRSRSGTVEEFERAFDLWVQHRAPTIMFYFNRAPFYPGTAGEVLQFKRVLQFKKLIAEKGLLWEYEGLEDFERKARPHLYRQIEALLSESAARTGTTAAVQTEVANVPRAQTSAYYEMMQHFLKNPEVFGDEIRNDESSDALTADHKARFHRFIVGNWSKLDDDERGLLAEMPKKWESIRRRWNAMSNDKRSSLRNRFTNVFASTNRAFLDARSPEEKAMENKVVEMLMESSREQHEINMDIIRNIRPSKPSDSET